MSSPVCVITGVGPGNGAAFARKFAAEGFQVAMLARSSDRLQELEADIERSKGYAVDVGRSSWICGLSEKSGRSSQQAGQTAAR